MVTGLREKIGDWWPKIDWDATGSMLQGYGAILGIVAIVWAAIEGKSRFQEWKAQKIAERHIEQAERILLATYRAQNAIAVVQSRGVMSNELDAACETLTKQGNWGQLSEQERLTYCHRQAFLTRISNSQKEFKELIDALMIARVFFPKNGLVQQIEGILSQFELVRNEAASRATPNPAAVPTLDTTQNVPQTVKCAVLTIAELCNVILDPKN